MIIFLYLNSLFTRKQECSTYYPYQQQIDYVHYVGRSRHYRVKSFQQVLTSGDRTISSHDIYNDELQNTHYTITPFTFYCWLNPPKMLWAGQDLLAFTQFDFRAFNPMLCHVPTDFHKTKLKIRNIL